MIASLRAVARRRCAILHGSDSWDTVRSGPTRDLTDPYNGPINASANPLTGLRAWCNTQPYLNSIVDINSYAGQTMRFRFRIGSDASVAAEGWYIDDVKVQGCQASPVDGVFSNGFEGP